MTEHNLGILESAMGWNYHMNDDNEANILPPEAFDHSYSGHVLEIDDGWLRLANDDDKLTAMRAWFFARYCDPAEETPYNGREGGYLFVHGGPYDPTEEISHRFSDLVSDKLIDVVVDEMIDINGDQWAPIDFGLPDDYQFDVRFELSFVSRDEPLRRLRERLQQIQMILTLQGNGTARALAEKLVFGAVIGALEAFLWETVSYWVENDDETLREMVTKLPKFRDEPMKMGEIFDRQINLKSYVQGYLQNVVWHRWDQVAPLFKIGLGIELDSTKVFQKALVKRHDIVHRSGHNKCGEPIMITVGEIQSLCADVETFCANIDARLSDRRPPTGPQF